MLILKTKWGDKMCLYKEGTSFEETVRNIQQKNIDNRQLMVVSSTGGGKSVLTNALAWEYKEQGYTVIYVTSKPSNEYDNAFCIFQPDRMYHLRLLQSQRQTALKPETLQKLAKFYHPFTFNAPQKGKSIPIQWFTFPLKNVTERGFASILAGEVDHATVRMCIQEIEKLPKDGTIYDFVQRLATRISKDTKDKQTFDMENFGLPYEKSGRKDILQNIVDGFKIFREHYCLRHENDPQNIDMIKMLNDQKSMHFLSTQYIKDMRTKYFIYITFIEEIKHALESGEVNYPVCLVFEEIKVLLPRTTRVSYEAQLSLLFRELLSTVRTKGRGVTTIATTQSFHSTNREYRDALNAEDIFLGKLSQPDMKAFKRQNAVLERTVESELLNSLKVGEFVWLGSVLHGDLRKFKVNVPPFKIAEEDDNFFELYEENYKDKLTDFTLFFQAQKNAFTETEKAVAKKYPQQPAKQPKKKNEANLEELDEL